MKPPPHAPTANEARRRFARAGPALLLLVGGALAMLATGCDIVQGFQDAGDSLFPEQATHLASPGVRLVSGSYRELGLLAGSEIYLIARQADDESGKLLAMRYVDPRPCEIEGVGRYSTTRDAGRRAPLLSYFHENVRRGTLHFADATCKTYPLSFDDARLPVAETADSVVVWAGSELWRASPETDSREQLADGVEEVIRGVFGKRFAVRSNGRLTLFDAAWKEQGSFGEQVGSVLRVGKSLFYDDLEGAHRISANETDSSKLEHELLVNDACSLGSQDGIWVTLRAPCAGGKVVAFHEPTGSHFTLPFDADPRRLKLVPARNSPGRDPLTDPFWFFDLRSGETESEQDTLFVRTPSGEEHALGARAALDQVQLLESEGETHGYALIDIEGETGRYVWWNETGETRVLGEQATWRSDRLLVDFDGTLGNVAVVSGDRLLTLAKGVPWQAFEFQDGTRDWTVLLHDVEPLTATGRLSVMKGGLDELQATPPDQPLVAPELTEIGSGVLALGISSLNDVLSGVMYFTDFDFTTGTGRLAYRNLELRFTAEVSDGVSGYLVTHDEVLYSVPYGDKAGIWLVSGK